MSTADRRRVWPCPDRFVRDPLTRRPIDPAAGLEVEWNIYWERRLQDGDVGTEAPEGVAADEGAGDGKAADSGAPDGKAATPALANKTEQPPAPKGDQADAKGA